MHFFLSKTSLFMIAMNKVSNSPSRLFSFGSNWILCNVNVSINFKFTRMMS